MQRRLSYAAAGLFAFGASLVILVGAQTWVSLRPSAATDLVLLGVWEALVYVVATFGILQAYAPERAPREALGLRVTHPAMLAFGLAQGLVLHVPAESLAALVERRWPTPEIELIQRSTMLHPAGPVRTVLFVLVVACVVPLVEEVFFRGALYTTLRRSSSAVGAAVLTATCFVLSHADMRVWLPFVLVSMVLTHLRAASGSVLPGLALHVGFNALTLASVLTGVSSPDGALAFGLPVMLAGWAISLALIFAVQYLSERSPEAESARAEDADER
jgi:membrane protease YdiL (CAAX protease family)